MDVTVLDKNFKAVKLIDAFKSLIWTDRYVDTGDFELYIPATLDYLHTFLNNTYVTLSDIRDTMIIDGLELKSDSESGDEIHVIGRSLVSLLDRRIIWKAIKYSGDLQTGIERILNENVINPEDPKRKINNFIFMKSNDPRILNMKIDYEVFGDNVLDFIKSICSEKKVGFRVDLNERNDFVFSLYMGIDRSYEQSDIPPVVFSPLFDNIISSNYIKTHNNYRNVTLIGTQQNTTMTVSKPNTNDSGLDRYEMYTTASTDKSKDELKQFGLEELNKNKGEDLFEGEVDSIHTYKYGDDFRIGDIIQLQNAYGMSSKTRVVEFVRNESENGIETYPSFEVVD